MSPPGGSAARLLALAVLLAGTVAGASETGLTGAEGHPRSRFPLAVFAASTGDAALDAAVRKAVADWNPVFQEALAAPAFTWVGREADAAVVVTFDAAGASRLMGETRLRADADGVIALPVRIVVLEPRALGETPRETLVYQVVAHELGHALGLEHVRDPRSLMCCVHGSIDFNDPAAREAYIQARRHPEVRSVLAQLTAHYARFSKQP